MADNHASAETISTSDIPEHPLLRDESSGMNPVTLATGFYGARGERIRHQVHEGALRLPEIALNLIVQSDEQNNKQAGIEPGKPEYALPGLDSVVRPTVDLNLPQLIVTEVMNEEVSQDVISPEDGTVQSLKFSKTVSRNRLILRDTPTDRIRGGGEPGEHAMDEETNRTAQRIVDNTILNVATSHSNSTEAEGLAVVVDNTPMPTLQNPTTAMDIDPNPAMPYVPSEPSILQTLPVPIEAGITLNSDLKATVIGSRLGAESLTHSNPPTNLAPESTEPSSIPVSIPTVNVSTPPSVMSGAIADAQSSVDSKPVLHPKAILSTAFAPMNTDDLDARVVPLKKRPPPHWDQRKNITVDGTDCTPVVVSSPEWYQSNEASSIERATLGEWFDGSAGHRTPEAYIHARSTMIEMSTQLGPSRYLTATLARRSIPGDAGSLLRMHAFLTSYGLINADTTNETTPAPAVFQKKAASWDDSTLRESLMRAIVDVSRKRTRLTGSSSEYMPIDWNAVAIAVGQGTTPTECERTFMSMPITTDDGTATPRTTFGGEGSIALQSLAPTTSRQAFVLQDLVDGTEPSLLSTVVNAALCHTNNLSQAQSAGTIGLACSQALDVVRVEEEAATRIMAEIVDLRMRKLESRMELLDEIEGMLEAERVDLELERRDLYTARCRHWFGGT